jgi:hypothetical protein
MAERLTLFDDFQRTNSDPADYSEAQFAFLNRSAQPRDARIRQAMETWFAEYPADEQQELKRRLESNNTGQSYESAFFELSLHTLLKRLGCGMTVHPELPGTSRRPEFLITEPDSSQVILEARLAGGESVAEAARKRLKATIYDFLNERVKTDELFFNVVIRGAPKQQPSSKDLARFIQSHLDATDADALIAAGEAKLPRWEWRLDEQCIVAVSPIPIKPERRAVAGRRSLGMTVETYWGGDESAAVRDAVLEKANRYGQLDDPFIVAINTMTPFGLEMDGLTKALTDLWQRERVKQVGAVLLASWLMPISAAHAAIGLYHNPNAERRYSGVLTALPQGFTEDGRIRTVEGRSLGDVFGLPADWPRQGDEV